MSALTSPGFLQRAEAAAADLLSLSPAYAPTPLLDLNALAARLGIRQLLAKHEGRRMLGSFKSLGGTYAGLRALARYDQPGLYLLRQRRPGHRRRLTALSVCRVAATLAINQPMT